MAYAPTDRFAVLYVCWANQCRSAAAQLMLSAALDETRSDDCQWVVRSAGVAARTGAPLFPAAARVLTRRGVTDPGFRSRPLTTELVGAADLILTAERAHRTSVVQLDPSALHRAFTMRQFARLAPEESPDTSSRAGGLVLLRAALDNRGLQQSVPADGDDIADPVGGPHRGFQRCIDEIAGTLSAFGVAASSANRPSRRWRRSC
ncbi:MAG: hypothetical protein ACR2P2_00540 [Nakamurella sp.]